MMRDGAESWTGMLVTLACWCDGWWNAGLVVFWPLVLESGTSWTLCIGMGTQVVGGSWPRVSRYRQLASWLCGPQIWGIVVVVEDWCGGGLEEDWWWGPVDHLNGGGCLVRLGAVERRLEGSAVCDTHAMSHLGQDGDLRDFTNKNTILLVLISESFFFCRRSFFW